MEAVMEVVMEAVMFLEEAHHTHAQSKLWDTSHLRSPKVSAAVQLWQQLGAPWLEWPWDMGLGRFPVHTFTSTVGKRRTTTTTTCTENTV